MDGSYGKSSHVREKCVNCGGHTLALKTHRLSPERIGAQAG